MLKTVKKHIIRLLESAVGEAVQAGNLFAENLPGISLEVPRHDNHGDVSSNICFLIGKQNGLNPRKLSGELLNTGSLEVKDDPYIEKIEAAGPGFLNFFLKPRAHHMVLEQILSEGGRYGSSDCGDGEKVLIEFVSANPTGPLHIGHARNAVVGDVLARIMTFAGYSVRKEYYLNDAGNQIHSLGQSLKKRYLQASGKKGSGELEYKGEYLLKTAEEILCEDGGVFKEHTDEFFSNSAVEKITGNIKKDLNAFYVAFDSWFSEKSLHGSGMIEKMAALLKENGAAEDRDGALWFLSSKFGDEKDRVIIRKNGLPTYLAADIAYHYKKMEAGFDRLINVLGADHHGYVPRLKGVIEALGGGREMLDVVLIQLVRLLRAGQPVPMSTRSGEFATLRDVLDEVGNDSLRFFMLMRRSDAQLDFDIELAKKHSVENPVYYVQYAHARISSLFRKADENNLRIEDNADVDCGLLTEEPEISLAKILGYFPEVVEGSARGLEPHRLTSYLQEAASKFHNFYDKLRVVGEAEETARARLCLAGAACTVIANGLGLLGISCPDEM